MLTGDLGFKKWGFDRTVRRSFTDYLDNLEQTSNGRFRYFLPRQQADQFLDRNFNPAGIYQALPPGNRHRARTANSSAASNTKSRWHVESMFGREHCLQILGSRYEMPQQYFAPCQIPGHENQPAIFVWLCVGDVLIRNYTAGFQHTYPTVDTYFQHGLDLRNRVEMENPLSEFSGITWSRDIFRRPTQIELRQGNVRHVDLMNSNQTGVVGINFNELTSLTLGSFQPKLANSYITKLRRLQVENNPYINVQVRDQQLRQLPHVEAYVWEEVHGAGGPPGWNNAAFWPWEDVQFLLTFIPARMKADKKRSVVFMYKPQRMPLPVTNNMGFRTPNMSRLKCWICGPAAGDACPLGERLAGCCSHCSTAVYLAAVLPNNPNLFVSHHRSCQLLDRANPQRLDEDLVAEVLS